MFINPKRINLEWQILRAVELGDKSPAAIAERIGCSVEDVEYVRRCIIAEMIAEIIVNKLSEHV